MGDLGRGRRSFRRLLIKHAGVVLEAAAGHVDVLGAELDEDRVSAELLGDEAGGSGAGEHVEDVALEQADGHIASRRASHRARISSASALSP